MPAFVSSRTANPSSASARWRAARFVLLSGGVILATAIGATLVSLRYLRSDDAAYDEQFLSAVTGMVARDIETELLLARGVMGPDAIARLNASTTRYGKFAEARVAVVNDRGEIVAGGTPIADAAALQSAIAQADKRPQVTPQEPTAVAIADTTAHVSKIRMPESVKDPATYWVLLVRPSADAHHGQHQSIAWMVATIFSLAMLTMLVWLSRRYVHSERDVELTKQALNLEMKYRDLIEAQQIVKCGSWTTDATMNNFFPSLEYLNIFKLTPETCPKTIDQVIAQLVHPSQQIAARENIKRILSGESYEGTRRVQLRDGTEKWLLFRAEPRHDANGKLIGHRGIVIDITSHQLAERRAIEGEKRYRLITENATDIVSLHDRDGRVLYCSPSIRRAFGYDPIKSIGVLSFSLVHPDDQRELKDTLRSLLDGEVETTTTMCRFRNASGHYRWLESVVAPVIDPQRGFQHYQVVSRDVTRRKNALDALHASEERFRSLTELSADWYWEQDGEYRFTFISKAPPAAENVISQALIGRSHWDAFPDALGPEGWDAHRSDLSARRPFQNLIVEIGNPESSRVSYYSLSGRPVYDAQGKFIGYRGTGRDITARHLTELSLARRTRELAETNSALEEEVATRQRLERDFLLAIEMELAQIGLELHDDLGQDLTGIALLTSALSRKLREQGHAGNTDAARISELVNRTIKHTRMISHGLSPYIWGSTGLVAALTQLASDIDTLGVARCETILETVEISDEVVARSLYRIAQESVNNALKHSQANRITIALKANTTGVELTISDDGKGWGDANSLRDSGAKQGDRKFHSIRHRANAIDATLSIGARDGTGTMIRVVWHRPAAADTAATIVDTISGVV
jgi:PAS domain S-box-containing protein